MSCILSKNGLAMFYINKKRVSKKEFYKKYPNFSEKNCKLSKEKQKLEEDIKSLKSIKKDIDVKLEQSPLKSYKQQIEDYKNLLIEKEKNLIEYTDRFIKEQNINLENLKKIKDCKKQKENINILKTNVENISLKYEKSMSTQDEYSKQIKKLEDDHKSLSEKHNETLAKLNISEENYKKEIKLKKESEESKECEQIKSDLITCKSVNETYLKDLQKLRKEYEQLLYSNQIIEESKEKEIEENKKLLEETYNQMKILREELSLSKSREKEIEKKLEDTQKNQNIEIYNNKVKENRILDQELRIKTLLDEIKEKTDRLQIDVITKQDLEKNIKILQDKLINLSIEDDIFKKKVKEEKDEFLQNQVFLDRNIKTANKLIDNLIRENRLKTLEIEKLYSEKEHLENESDSESYSEKDDKDESDSQKDEKDSQDITLFDYLKDLQKKDPNKTEKVVLITTGSFNPIHKTHIRMAILASDKCNKNTKFRQNEGPIVAIVFSPSSDIYLKDKMKRTGNEKDSINQEQRLEMINLAIKDYNEEDANLKVRLFSDDWEMKNGNPDFDRVTQSLDERIVKERIPNIKVVYLCGADHLTKYISPKYLLKGKYKSVGVNRYDDGKPLITDARRKEYEIAKNHYVVDFDLIDSIQYENYDPSASSTKVRKAAYDFDKKTLSTLLFPSTLTYLITHNIFDLGNEKNEKQEETKKILS